VCLVTALEFAPPTLPLNILPAAAAAAAAAVRCTGYVKTDMTSGNGWVEVEESASGILKVRAALSRGLG